MDKSQEITENVLKYVSLIYQNAEQLKILNHADLSFQDEEVKSEDEYDVIRHHYNKGTIEQYLCNEIKRILYKTDPTKQSLWTADIARKNFVVRDELNDELQWFTDVGANTIVRKIIEPISEHVEKIIDERIKTINERHNRDIDELLREMDKTTRMRLNIRKKYRSILKYMMPIFKLRKLQDAPEIDE